MFRTNYVGVDIGSGFITLMHKDKIHKLDTPANTVENGEILDIDSLSLALKNLIKQNKLTGKKAVISYNGPSIFTKIIKLPFMTSSEIEKYLRLEAHSIVPFSVDQGALDYIEIAKDEKSMEILIIALRNELVLPYVNVVNKAGLVAIAIDIPALAIARVIFKEKMEGLQLIMDIGKTTTNIHIYIDSVFRFSRNIKIGRDDFDSGSLMDLETELTRSIDYFRYSYGNQNTKQFTSAYIVGEDDYAKELMKLVHKAIGIEPTRLDDSNGILAKGLKLWRDKV